MLKLPFCTSPCNSLIYRPYFFPIAKGTLHLQMLYAWRSVTIPMAVQFPKLMISIIFVLIFVAIMGMPENYCTVHTQNLILHYLHLLFLIIYFYLLRLWDYISNLKYVCSMWYTYVFRPGLQYYARAIVTLSCLCIDACCNTEECKDRLRSYPCIPLHCTLWLVMKTCE